VPGTIGAPIDSPAVKVDVVATPLTELGADLVAVGLADGEELPGELGAAPGAADARSAYRKVAVLHPESPARVVVVGLGPATELDLERLRVAAALAVREAGRVEAASLAWIVPASGAADLADAAGAITEGTVLAAYRFDRYRSRDPDDPPPRIERLALAVPEAGLDAARSAVETARVVSEAANRARELQNLPANELTPEALAKRAEEIGAAHEKVAVDILDRSEIRAAGLGGLVAVSQGSDAEPRLIAMRYEGGGSGETVGLVGKAVTFDSGGISIKPSSGMHEMKMDMSGGAAVLEAIGAIAELGLAIDLVAVVPASENMPSGSAIRPGDIITQLNGKTVEVNNTDAEGRLILADALTWSVREMGADRVVDLATLTGAVLIALGSTYAALISNDDEWAGRVEAAATASGELAWRLPLHAEYKELTKGTAADLTNAAAKRKAGTIYAGAFLEEFVDGKPWAHLDIAGTAWDTGRAYVGKGATGFGVRLLVRLARDLSG
jgi:leucyl aminopeptidase